MLSEMIRFSASNQQMESRRGLIAYIIRNADVKARGNIILSMLAGQGKLNQMRKFLEYFQWLRKHLLACILIVGKIF